MVTKTHYKMSLKTVSYYLQTWYKKVFQLKQRAACLNWSQKQGETLLNSFFDFFLLVFLVIFISITSFVHHPVGPCPLPSAN